MITESGNQTLTGSRYSLIRSCTKQIRRPPERPSTETWSPNFATCETPAGATTVPMKSRRQPSTLKKRAEQWRHEATETTLAYCSAPQAQTRDKQQTAKHKPHQKRSRGYDSQSHFVGNNEPNKGSLKRFTKARYSRFPTNTRPT